MQFWLEWMLAVHRAVWFPFHWVTGLERPGVDVPVELNRLPATVEGGTRTIDRMAGAGR